jgi:tetratricopeptide (TPR) repeat protein
LTKTVSAVILAQENRLICLGLVLATLAVYAQARGFGFYVLDDDDYVVNNAVVQRGITWEGVRWAFTTGTVANWHPVTWLSHMADCAMFGMRPAGHHAVSVLFHAINAALLFLILRRMTHAEWPSAFVAAVFALHPLRVESVVWVAERKDVLSTLFWLLTTAAYVGYVRRRSAFQYALVIILFAIGLMAKPMLVTLPCALLLLDYWPLGRFNPVTVVAKKKTREIPPNRWALVAEKLPLFGLALGSCVVTYIVQQRGGAVRSLAGLSLWARAANAVVSYVRYVEKTAVPRQLAVFYPHPKDGIPWWEVLGALIVLGAITASVIRWRKRHPYLTVGWLWYLGTLVPVIGLVQVGSQAIADRYTYVPGIGLLVMAAWGVPALVPAVRYRRAALAVGAAGVAAALALGAWNQLGYWRDSVTLFEHALAVAPRDNDFAHFNLGIALKRAGRPDDAATHFAEAVRIRPSYVNAHIYLGLIEYERGKYEEATRHYGDALDYAAGHPNHGDAENNLGAALAAMGKNEEAASHYAKALELRPGDADTQYNLANTMMAMNKVEEALAHYREMLRINPNHPYAHIARDRLQAANAPGRQAAPPSPPTANTSAKPQTADEAFELGNTLAQEKKYAEAAARYEEALRLKPDKIDARINLGNALAAQGKLREAIARYREVLSRQPNNVDAFVNVGTALGELGDLAGAAREFARAVQLNPRHLDACCGLGYTLAKQGKLEEAAQAFSRALLIDPKCKPAQEALKNIQAQRK